MDWLDRLKKMDAVQTTQAVDGDPVVSDASGDTPDCNGKCQTCRTPCGPRTPQEQAIVHPLIGKINEQTEAPQPGMN